jgi:hypothetical protein
VEADIDALSRFDPELATTIRTILAEQTANAKANFTRRFLRVHNREPTVEQWQREFAQGGRWVAESNKHDVITYSEMAAS